MDLCINLGKQTSQCRRISWKKKKQMVHWHIIYFHLLISWWWGMERGKFRKEKNVLKKIKGTYAPENCMQSGSQFPLASSFLQRRSLPLILLTRSWPAACQEWKNETGNWSLFLMWLPIYQNVLLKIIAVMSRQLGPCHTRNLIHLLNITKPVWAAVMSKHQETVTEVKIYALWTIHTVPIIFACVLLPEAH